jgi:hypothetical protein
LASGLARHTIAPPFSGAAMNRFACLALTLAGLVGCTNDPEPAAAQTGLAPPLQEVAGPDWSKIPSTYECRARILATSGGALSLPDGTTVEFPPGAVAADTDVTLERLAYEGPEARSSRLYRIEPDLTLTASATISVPFDPAAGEPTGVAYFDPRAGWTEAPADVDRSAGRVAVRTDHFSVWRFTDPIWALIARQTIGDPAKGAMLSVPYYSQGGSNWCWGAATQMILKRHDVDADAEIWDLARGIGVAKQNGVTLEQLWNGTYVQLLEARGLSVERSVMGWTFKEDLTGYLIYQLTQGRPVWLALPMISHVIVVVGFTSDKIYFHDPTEENVLLKRLEQGRTQPGKTHMAATSVTWQDWYDALSKWHRVVGVPQPFFSPGLGLMHTVVITSQPPEPKPPVTVSILTDEDVGFTPAGRTGPVTFLCYDGREADGLRFTEPSQQDDPTALERTYGILPSMVSGSDSLSKFTVHLANGGPVDQTASVYLTLDGQPLREKTGVSIPRFISNLEVDLIDQNNPHSLAAVPLALGRHQLAVSVVVEGREVDTSLMRFNVGPATPKGLMGVRDGNRLRFRWAPNPEAAGSIRYVVRKDGRPFATVDGTTWEDDLRGDFREVKFQYRIEAQDASDPSRTSMPSEWPQWEETERDPLVGVWEGTQTLTEAPGSPDLVDKPQPYGISFTFVDGKYSAADGTLGGHTVIFSGSSVRITNIAGPFDAEYDLTLSGDSLSGTYTAVYYGEIHCRKQLTLRRRPN